MELRWLERKTDKRLMDDWGFYYDETKRILQYRVKIAKANYDSLDSETGDFTVTSVWSEWQDIPVVVET